MKTLLPIIVITTLAVGCSDARRDRSDQRERRSPPVAFADLQVANKLPRLAKQARVVPSLKDGRLHGYKLYAIRPESTLARAGFQNGDTVVAVAGAGVSSPAAMVMALAHARTPVPVLVTRRGQLVNLRLPPLR